MAITINSDKREELLNSNVEVPVNNDYYSGNSKAGITDTFKMHLTRDINDYCNNIRSCLNNFDEIPINIVFKGETIESQMKQFITSLKEVANNYINKLEKAEDQIIEGVYKAYVTQDSDLSSEIKKTEIN